MSTSLLCGLALAESTGATTPGDTVPETSGGATPDTVADSGVTTTPETLVDTSVATTPEGAALDILPPDGLWAGVTRAEWEARSWQWLLSMPQHVSPSFDMNGDRCGYGQSGPVFFLPGVFSDEVREFTCVVPEGTAIYSNGVGTECSTVEPPPFFGLNEDELRACASASFDEFGNMHARIDRQEVLDLESYRIGSPLFTLTFPEENVFGVEPGVAQSVSESYGFIIAPPSPGTYEIVYSEINPGGAEVVATYTVIVQAPQVIEPPPNNSTAP